MFVCTWKPEERPLRVLLYHSPSHCFETESPTKPAVRLVASKSRGLLSLLPTVLGLRAHPDMPGILPWCLHLSSAPHASAPRALVLWAISVAPASFYFVLWVEDTAHEDREGLLSGEAHGCGTRNMRTFAYTSMGQETERARKQG